MVIIMKNWFWNIYKKCDFGLISKFVWGIFLTIIAIITMWIYRDAPIQGRFRDLGKNDVWFGESWYDDTNAESSLVPTINGYCLKAQAQDGYIKIKKVLEYTPSHEEFLCFRSRAQDVKVYVNDKVWYESSFKEKYRPYAMKMDLLHQMSTQGMQTGDCITIELHSVVEKDHVIIQYPVMGDRYGIVRYMVRKSRSNLFICLIAVFLTMISLILSVFFFLTGEDTDLKSTKWLNIFMALAVVYLGTDSVSLNIFIEKTFMISWVNALSFFLLPIPFMLFIRHAFFPGHMRYMVLSTIEFLLVIMGVIGFVCFAYNMTNFYMPVHIIIIVGSLLCIVSFWQEKMIFSGEVLIGIGAIFVTAIVGIVFYWRNVVYPSSVVFGCGFLVFSTCMLIWIVKCHHEFNSMRKEATQMIMQREKEAIEEASEQKSRFLSHMSHEMRTPLNAIVGMNEMILHEAHDRTIKEYAANIQSAGRTLLALVSDVLDFSKIEAGKLDIVESDYSLSTILNDVLLMIQQRAEDKQLELRLDIDDSLPDLLHGDEIRIKQILTNLMTNAVKYTTQGWVELAAGKQKMVNDQEIILEFRVSDSGIGIKEEDFTKIFTEFEQLDGQNGKIQYRSIEGTGLGLPITSRLVELMNGKIGVNSEYGKGASFVVIMPQQVVSLAPIGDYKRRFGSFGNVKEEIEPELVTYPGKRVFVVDDNEMNLEVIASILEMLEIQVERADGGQAAIDQLNQTVYDLIITDDMMPQVSGTDLMLYLHKHTESVSHRTPIVVLTANAVAGAMEEYINKGFDDYMSKPIDIDVLQKILMKYLK